MHKKLGLRNLFVCMVLWAMVQEASCTILHGEEADRLVAEWTISLGGSVRVAGEPNRHYRLGALPQDDFELDLVDLVGTNILPPDLVRLSNLQKLRFLYLPGPMWNPSAGSKEDYSKELNRIAGLKTLEELSFSYTYLAGIKFQDDGIEAIRSLGSTLRKLSLENTAVKGRHLSAFTQLESLDLVYCPIDNKGMSELEPLANLRVLLLRDGVFDDTGLSFLANLLKLERLDLGGTKVTDDGFEKLSQLSRLKHLNLQGTLVTDRTSAWLEKQTDLEELNLYGTKFSNVGVERLQKLSKLRFLDLRYTRATQSAVDALRSALPACEIHFLDSDSRPALSTMSNRIVEGQRTEVIVDWGQSLGGHGEERDGSIVGIALGGSSITDSLVQNLRGLPHLQWLELNDTEIGDLGLKFLEESKALERLDLSGTAISDNGLSSLSGLTNLKRLALKSTALEGNGIVFLKDLPIAELSLSNAPIRDRAIDTLAQLSSLRFLSLAYTDITDKCSGALEQINNLDSLDLDGSDITDTGLDAIGRIGKLKTLRLSYTKISDKGIRKLEQLKDLEELTLLRTRITNQAMETISAFSKLQCLDLDYTEINDEGIKRIANLSALKLLSLDSTHLTDASASFLSELSSLEWLNLYHTLMTPKGFETIHSKLPKCKILFEAASSDPKRRRS